MIWAPHKDLKVGNQTPLFFSFKIKTYPHRIFNLALLSVWFCYYSYTFPTLLLWVLSFLLFPSFYFGYNISQPERYIVQKTGDWKPGYKLCYEFIRIAINYKVFQSRGWDQFCFVFCFLFPFNFVMLPRWWSSIANLDTQIIKNISLYVLGTYLNYFLNSGKIQDFIEFARIKIQTFATEWNFTQKRKQVGISAG